MEAVVSWLALAVSALAVAWSVVAWRRDGPCLSVSVVRVVSQPDESDASDGYGVVVTNTGRQETAVHELSISVLVVGVVDDSGKREVVVTRQQFLPDNREAVPARISAGAEVLGAWPLDRIWNQPAGHWLEISALRGHARAGNQWVAGKFTGETRYLGADGVSNKSLRSSSNDARSTRRLRRHGWHRMVSW